MTSDQAKILLQKYNQGQLNQSEEKDLEKCIELGLVQLEELQDLHQLSTQLDQLIHQELSKTMKGEFQKMMAIEKARPKSSIIDQLQFVLGRLMPGSPLGNLALASVMLILGLAVGNQLFKSSSSDQSEEIATLSTQMEEMKEMMMLNLLEKDSPSDRLKAVNMTQDLEQASKKVTDALFTTLNTDENVNVRLEALNVLYQYANNPRVREGLIRSISQQDDPLMQIAIAEVMVALQEKNSVPALKELLGKEQVPEMIKEKLQEKIDILL